MAARPGWSPPTAASGRSCWWCGRRSGGCRPASRAVVVLRYHEDLPELEVARLLGIPAGTVKSTANRALARLRKQLAGHPVDHADSWREPR